MTLNKIVLCTCHFFVLLLLQFVIANCNNGFSLKLIHRDSEESPLYPGDLTLEERVERLHQQSDARLNYYLAKIADDAIVDVDDQFRNLQPEMVSSRLTFYLDSFYLAKIGLGTFDHSPQQPNNYQSYYLIVDTGSELTWTQCEPCKGFPQAQPVFPPSKSKSYRLLSCNKHSLCYRDICQHGYCSYAMKYMTNQSSYGYLGIDRFTFELENGAVESIDGLVFGCGHTQQNFKINSTRNPINGILGMGTGPRSLINQLRNRARGKFSYCIPRWKFPTDKIYLRFGNEAEFRQGLHFSTTTFIQGQALPTYYVKLLDISVAGNRLHFPPGFFDIKQDGTGGCFIDSGSPFSYLPQGAYTRVRDAVASYWAHIHLPVKQKPGYDLCYQVPRRDQQPPPIIFHFLNADLIVGSGAYISYVNDAICFAFKSSEDHGGVSIIGALAQSDYRFLFDLATKTLSFARDDCRKNP